MGRTHSKPAGAEATDRADKPTNAASLASAACVRKAAEKERARKEKAARLATVRCVGKPVRSSRAASRRVQTRQLLFPGAAGSGADAAARRGR